MDRTLVSMQDVNFLAFREIPHPSGPVPAGAGEPVPFPRECHGKDVAGMTLELSPLLARASRAQPFVVGGKSDGPHATGAIMRKTAELLPPVQAPQASGELPL